MAETIALPAAMPASGFAAGSPSSRASCYSGSADGTGTSFSSALRSVERGQAPRSGHDDTDKTTTYAGAAATATATPPPLQPQNQPVGGDGQTEGNGGTSAASGRGAG